MAQRLHGYTRRRRQRPPAANCAPLPVGLLYDEAGEVAIDPDAEVQAAIGDLFTAFAVCGSAYGVVAAFAERRFPLRAYGGAWAGQLRWGKLTHARVLGVLKNQGMRSSAPDSGCAYLTSPAPWMVMEPRRSPPESPGRPSTPPTPTWPGTCCPTPGPT